MIVRTAQGDDINPIVDLLCRAQEKLANSGSMQRLTVLERDAVADRVRRGGAHVLATPQSILGVVFVERVTTETMPVLARWGVSDAAVWFVQSLVIEPKLQGQGLGLTLLDGVKQLVEARGPGTIMLDCWAGNGKLRAFYARAGYKLVGEFPDSTGEYRVAVFARRTPG